MNFKYTLVLLAIILIIGNVFFNKKNETNYTVSQIEKRYINNINLLDTININTFGAIGNNLDETKLIQRALNESTNKILYIPKQSKDYYLIGELTIPNNITILCDSSVVFKSRDDLRQNIEDFQVMFRFENSKNVTFNGNGAIFQMNKSAYSGEHNHIFMINGAENITLKNINAYDSGGDGFYIGAKKTSKLFSEKITIDNCISLNARRQGLSITSAKDIKVTNCKFNTSNGTDPQSGIDIEPNDSNAYMENILIFNTKAEGNKKRGFVVNLQRLNSLSKEVSIYLNNCIAVNNTEGFSMRSFSGVKGDIYLNNCVSENSLLSGFTEYNCLYSSIKSIYNNCKAINSYTYYKKENNNLFKAGFYISSDQKNNVPIGNTIFNDCEVINPKSNIIDYGFVIDSHVGYKYIEINGLRSINTSKGSVLR